VDDVTIGFAQSQLAAPYFAAMQVRAQQIAKEQASGCCSRAQRGPVVQMNQMQAMIAQGVDTLLVNATSVKGQKEMMTQIASQIRSSTSTPGADTGTTSVQSDNLTIGRESGKITAKAVPRHGQEEHQDGGADRFGRGRVRRPGPPSGLPGRLEGGRPAFEILSEQPGPTPRTAGRSRRKHAGREPRRRPSDGAQRLHDLGAYQVIKNKPAYENVYVAAPPTARRKRWPDQGGRLRRALHLHRTELALPGAEEALQIAVEDRDRREGAARLPEGVLHAGRRHRLRERRRAYDPQIDSVSFFLRYASIST
jgi:ribose transport system substrate-binding protein